MLNIPMKSKGPVNSQTILSLNQEYVRKPLSSRNISTLNQTASLSSSVNPQSCTEHTVSAPESHSVYKNPIHQTGNHSPHRNIISAVSDSPSVYSTASLQHCSVPQLQNKIRKGQKVSLNLPNPPSPLNVCLGWNILNPACDVDVSAFLLDATGKVPGDDWFVFYGQKQSPDKSTCFSLSQGTAQEMISVDLSRLNSSVCKIVFVLTINEALEKHLNFSMIQDAWLRILDSRSGQELVSFQMDEYYSNVTSMMIGEIYLYHGIWKFNAVGSGVAKDLAGLCELYGVQTV